MPGRPAEPLASRLARWPVAVVLLAVAGCGTGSGLPETTGAVQGVEPHTAFVVPPPGGPAIVGIVEQRFVNGVSQDIALSTASRVAGQNAIAVRLVGPVRFGAGGQSALPDRPISAASIASDMRKAFPGVNMGRSGFYVQNRYGPFGFAVGRRVAGTPASTAGRRIASTSTTTLLLRSRGVIQLRLRLCQAGASTEQLLAVMYGFSISVFFSDISWNPYGQTASDRWPRSADSERRSIQQAPEHRKRPGNRWSRCRRPARRRSAASLGSARPAAPVVATRPHRCRHRSARRSRRRPASNRAHLAPASRPAGPPGIVPPRPRPGEHGSCRLAPKRGRPRARAGRGLHDPAEADRMKFLIALLWAATVGRRHRVDHAADQPARPS